MTVNDGIGKPIHSFNSKVGLSYEDMLMDDFVFDMDSRDVMVFLHMQKTGLCFSVVQNLTVTFVSQDIFVMELLLYLT